MSEENQGTNPTPFYKSTKKTLGVIGFFLYWLVQVPAIIKDPSLVVSMSMANAAMVLGLLGIKTIGGAMQTIGGKK